MAKIDGQVGPLKAIKHPDGSMDIVAYTAGPFSSSPLVPHVLFSLTAEEIAAIEQEDAPTTKTKSA